MKTVFYFLLIGFLSLSSTSCVTTVRSPQTRTVVVKTLPKTHKIVYVRGIKYYKFNGKHYRRTSRGYIVVRV